jgi:RNA polymerase primary sigma factor
MTPLRQSDAGGGRHSDLTRDATRRGLLTHAEELLLAKRIERGDLAAKTQMIECNLRLVFALARTYGGRGVAFEDLVQEGTLGLVRAVEKFDHRRSLKFSTYALWWIRRSLMNAIGASRTIRVPAGAGRQLAAIDRAASELRRAARTPPSVEAIAARTGLQPRSVVALQQSARVTASLDELVGDEGTPLGELIADRDAVDASEEAARLESEQQVWRMLRVLPERHRQVLLRRYGLLGDEAETHQQIALGLGVGEDRSRQLEREALHWLRELGGGRQCESLAG